MVGKGVCAFISSNSRMGLYLVEVYLVLRGTNACSNCLEHVFLQMVSVLFWVHKLLPDLKKRGEAVCSNVCVSIFNSCGNASKFSPRDGVGDASSTGVD